MYRSRFRSLTTTSSGAHREHWRWASLHRQEDAPAAAPEAEVRASRPSSQPGRSALRADELIEDRDAPALGDREVVAVVRAAIDAEHLACLDEDAPDVRGVVREEVARILVSPAGRVPHAVRDATAVGVDEALDELPRMAFDEVPLPRLELDLPEMLGAWAELREDTRPVLPVA